MRTNIKRLAVRKCGAERAPWKVIKNAIIAFQQNNSLYVCSPDPLSRSDKRVWPARLTKMLTDTPNNYCNPAAHAQRVNKYVAAMGIVIARMLRHIDM